jgi:hypothetical protein
MLLFYNVILLHLADHANVFINVAMGKKCEFQISEVSL